MSSKNTWCSKADILKDLAQVTGRIGDVDESYIVVGERPPPPRRYEDDDEMKYRFRGCEQLPDDVSIAPDLAGITQMLRMVDNADMLNGYDNLAEDRRTRPAAPDEVITISKLNPNVAEFIPNGAATSSPSNKQRKLENRKESNISKNPKDECSTNVSKQILDKCNENDNREDCKGDTNFDINKRIDTSKLKPEEIKDITLKLRSKISDTTNIDNLHEKREKNVAMAAIMKLYAVTPNTPHSPAPEENNKPILFTPQYFERCPDSAKIEEETHSILVQENQIKQTNPSDKSKITESSDNTATVSSDNQDVATDRSNDPSPSISTLIKSPVENKSYEDPDVRESIKKVNKWLHEPKSPKPKGPAVFMGTISFKKKDKPKSPIIDSGSKRLMPTTSAVATNVAHYKPSKYAENLSKMYEERNKDNLRLSEDLWTRAENEMKAKEKKLKEQSQKPLAVEVTRLSTQELDCTDCDIDIASENTN